MSQTNTARYKYTPDEMAEKEFLSRFVVRHEIFDEIFEQLQEADYSVPNQHCILIGQRGQGKTTILRKLKIEVEKDRKLSKFLIPVKFSEEQYRVRQLCRFWEEIAGYLQTYHEDVFEDVLERIELHIDDDNYHSKCFSYLEKVLKKSKKKLLLLIDNIDVMLGKFKVQEQHQLREILLTSSSFIIVGASTKMFEQQYDYAKPFYEFFKIIRLEGLNYDESIALLSVLGDKAQSAKIQKIIKNTPQRIKTLGQITGGVPRTIIMLFDIFIENNATAFDDLMKVLDEVTPLYKDRMDDLPPVLQDIVDAIALNWDGMMTKEIAKKTRLKSKEVSAQLKQLEKYQMVEAISLGKNKIYLIKERFFNIWYLMRYGRKKDRNRVEWLVKFLLSWYDRSEIQGKARGFIHSLQNSTLHSSYVVQMGEALSYSGCLALEDEHDLKQNMQQYLKDNDVNLLKEVSESDAELIAKVQVLYNEHKLDEIIRLLLASKRESPTITAILGEIYYEQKIYDEAEKYYLKAIESGEIGAVNNLANLYKEQKIYDKAKKYYLQAIEHGDINALYNLANLYKEQKIYDKAEKYYLKAIESGDIDALNNLALLYDEQKIYNKAEKYYLKAIESGDIDALNNLCSLYFEENKNIEKALLEIEKNYSEDKFYANTHTYAIVLLWAENFEASYEKFIECLTYDTAIESEADMMDYFILLIAKGQLYKAKAFLEMPEYGLKERYKPLWYALMTLMQEDFPIEIKKMGSELRQTVDEVLEEIEGMRKKYSVKAQ